MMYKEISVEQFCNKMRKEQKKKEKEFFLHLAFTKHTY